MGMLGRLFSYRKTKSLSHTMSKRGSQNPNAKLSDGEVFTIRELWAVGHRNIKVIARTFDVSPTNVMKIVKRKTWTHI